MRTDESDPSVAMIVIHHDLVHGSNLNHELKQLGAREHAKSVLDVAEKAAATVVKHSVLVEH